MNRYSRTSSASSPASGAEVLFNISNDGWFGKSAARWQHLAIVRMRAAENRRWILRATNDGITATIDSAGRLAARCRSTPKPPLTPASTTSPHRPSTRRFGDWFPFLCASLALLCPGGRPRPLSAQLDR